MDYIVDDFDLLHFDYVSMANIYQISIYVTMVFVHVDTLDLLTKGIQKRIQSIRIKCKLVFICIWIQTTQITPANYSRFENQSVGQRLPILRIHNLSPLQNIIPLHANRCDAPPKVHDPF